MQQPTSFSTFSLVLLIFGLFLMGCQATETTVSSQESSARSSAANADEGLFTIHQSDGQILYEIPDSILGRDMAIMSRIAKT